MRFKPIPAHPDVLKALLDETISILNHYIPLIAARQAGRSVSLGGEKGPPLDTVLEYLDYPFRWERDSDQEIDSVNYNRELSLWMDSLGSNPSRPVFGPSELARLVRDLKGEIIGKFEAESSALSKHPIVPPSVVRGKQVNDRDKYIYLESCIGTDYKSIMSNVNKNEEWDRLSSVEAVRKAGRRFAERENLPPPGPRKRGRRKSTDGR